TETRALADYFELAARAGGDPKSAANWMMGDLARLLNASGREITESRISPDQLGAMIRLINEGTISGKIAKSLIEEMDATGQDPAEIVQAKGWTTIKDTGALAALVAQAMADNPKVVADIKEKGLVQKKAFLVGQVMRASQGKADPQEVHRLL